MPAQLVETKQTKYSQAQLIKGFIQGWIRLFGKEPAKRQIAVIFAQNALETGLTLSMWNNNIGNVKYVAKPGDTEEIKYCMLKNTWEIVNNKKIIYQPPHPATWFRAFDTLEEGIAHHFNFLRNNRYRIAWAAVESGDPALFAKLLKKQGYYTASEADYRTLMVRYFNQFMNGKDFDNALKAIADEAPKPEPISEPTPEPISVPEPIVVPQAPVEQPVPEPVKEEPVVQPKPNMVQSIGIVLTNVIKLFKRN